MLQGDLACSNIYYYCELYSHMTGNDVSDGNKKNVEGSEQS